MKGKLFLCVSDYVDLNFLMKMKISKIAFVSICGLILSVYSVSAAGNMFGDGRGPGGTPPGMGDSMTPPGMELPDDWEDMTDEEQRAYMEANRPEMSEGGMGRGGGGMELPDDWEDMTEEEQRAYMEANRPEMSEGGMGRGGGMELPDDWEDMTEEEQRAYMEANRPEMGEGNENGDTNRNTNRARVARNYSGFRGQLRSKKVFRDADEIENETAVQFLQQRGILDGYDDGSFGPQNPINRAESLKVLLTALGQEPNEVTEQEFSDVPVDAWYAGYVNKAKEEGIVDGYEDGTFQPAKTVNQVELLKIAFESFGIDLSDYEVTGLPDGLEENAWYAPYLQYALDNGLIDEDDVAPDEGMTREMFSEVIYRLIQQQDALQ